MLVTFFPSEEGKDSSTQLAPDIYSCCRGKPACSSGRSFSLNLLPSMNAAKISTNKRKMFSFMNQDPPGRIYYPENEASYGACPASTRGEGACARNWTGRKGLLLSPALANGCHFHHYSPIHVAVKAFPLQTPLVKSKFSHAESYLRLFITNDVFFFSCQFAG